MQSRREQPRLQDRLDAVRLELEGDHAPGRMCAWPGCEAQGAYRAPRAPERLRDFIWLCLPHVRAYNQNWDFFRGMSLEDIEAHRRADATWHRPSWRFGGSLGHDFRMRDPFDLFGEDIGPDGGRRRDDPHAQDFANGRGHTGHRADSAGPAAHLRTQTAAMMAVLGLELGFTFDELRHRYRQLAKLNHPDLNGGDRACEERLKRINEAYGWLVDNRAYV